jgi:hypothetical protein
VAAMEENMEVRFIVCLYEFHCQRNYNLLTYVPIHVLTLVGSSSGVVIYTFSLLNRKVCIHIYIYRLKMTTFYVHLYSNC